MNYKHTTIYFVMVAMIGLGTVAQAQSELKKADRHFENYEFALALENYNQAIQKKAPDLSTMQRIADAYRLTRQSNKAEEWYSKIVNTEGHEPINLYFYATALRTNGKYSEAKEYYQRWAEQVPEKSGEAQSQIAAIERAIKLQSRPATAEVKSLEALNNPDYSDFSPVQYGDKLIFTSDRGILSGDKKAAIYGWTGRPYLQLFTAEQDGTGNWAEPQALEEIINTNYHNATASAAEEGKPLYFTRTHMVPKKSKVNPDPTSWEKEPAAKEFINRLEIFVAERNGEGWANIQPFAFNKVEEYSVGHPALTADGNIMYFASDMPGSIGGTDIFYSVKQDDGTWGEPVNAGPAINTTGRESFPYVDADGKLYFASDGHIGLGGLDIFEAEGRHGEWVNVRNAGVPINSSKDDYGIMFTKPGEEGLFSSNRASNNGTEDIFSFEMLRRPVVIAIKTLERKIDVAGTKSEVPLPGTQITIAQKNLNDSTVVMTDEKGQHFIDSRSGDEFSILGKKDGYLTQEALTRITDATEDTVVVALLFDKNLIENSIVLEKIYYDLDKWNIRPDAATELDKLVTLLQNNPNIEIELSAHTDSRESLKYNQRLSERRAQSAIEYLVSKGINAKRLTAKGYGKTRLVNQCTDGVECSEEEHQLNRRTEFRIIKN